MNIDYMSGDACLARHWAVHPSPENRQLSSYYIVIMAEFSAVNHTALVEIPVLVCRPLSVFSEPCVLLGWCWAGVS